MVVPVLEVVVGQAVIGLGQDYLSPQERLIRLLLEAVGLEHQQTQVHLERLVAFHQFQARHHLAPYNQRGVAVEGLEALLRHLQLAVLVVVLHTRLMEPDLLEIHLQHRRHKAIQEVTEEQDLVLAMDITPVVEVVREHQVVMELGRQMLVGLVVMAQRRLSLALL